jgi:hypothetical protein
VQTNKSHWTRLFAFVVKPFRMTGLSGFGSLSSDVLTPTKTAQPTPGGDERQLRAGETNN